MVPEHVELRPLEHPDRTDAGHLAMWIDMFPAAHKPLPPAIDISPRKPIDVELRLIIYEVLNIKMSGNAPDVYVKASIPGLDKKKSKP